MFYLYLAMANQKLSKKEILRKNRSIEKLFNEASSFICFPYKVVYSFSDTKTVVLPHVAFIVPKRQFKKAVSRNNIRRKMREAFRKNKNDIYSLLNEKQKNLEFVMLYIANENLEYQFIENKMKEALTDLRNRIK